MKKYLLIASIMLVGTICSMAEEPSNGSSIRLTVGVVDNPTHSQGGYPRTPINPPSASLDDHTFYVNGEHSGYTLYLVDNSGDEPDVVYQVVIPAGVNAVVLPATLSGTYELQLHNGGAFYFYAEIILS